MPFYKNTNDEFGCHGIFESDSLDTAVEEMEPTIAEWATDAWHRTYPEDFTSSKEEWIANRISQIREAYRNQLELLVLEEPVAEKTVKLNLNKIVANTKKEVIDALGHIASIHGCGAPFINWNDTLLLPVRWVSDEQGGRDTYEEYVVYRVTRIVTCLGNCTLSLQTQDGKRTFEIERTMYMEK